MKVFGKSVTALLIAISVVLSGCGGGSRSEQPGSAEPPPDTTTPSGQTGCDGSCTNASSFLTAAQVQTVIAQAVAEANAQGVAATIAVVDRVGNPLGIFRMNGAPATVTITSGKGNIGGLDEIDVIPSELSALAKAITGAYLSSEGNAFSTRTASQIIQEAFNPGEGGQPSGPLFGVQFSQLPCSDLNLRMEDGTPGPKRSPLGLSADPGGMPLYIAGAAVGGIGVEADGQYTLDLSIFDVDRDVDELIAVAGSFGFAAPNDRRGDVITADGKVFRYADVGVQDLATDPGGAAGFDSITGGALGDVIPVPAYFDGVIKRGRAFGQPDSGYRPDGDTFYPGLDAFVLVDADNNNRFPPRAGTNGANALTADEVQTLVQQAITVANRARAQIRRPVGSQMRVTVSIVDTNGVILALARTRDGPVFGTDVSLQKARTATFYSGDYAGDDLRSAADVTYLGSGEVINFETDYVNVLKDFLGSPSALDDGAFAFADRSGGNLSRPFYPDGVRGTENGPFSKPFDGWSIFNDGIQLDLVYNQVINHVLFYLGAAPTDVPRNCTGLGRLPNGIQIFPGSVPIYRGSTLVGGIGVSGDGVDQDDMVSFLGLHNAGEVLGTINNAPPEMRADTLAPRGSFLRYVQCPQSPFLDSDEQNVCEGK